MKYIFVLVLLLCPASSFAGESVQELETATKKLVLELNSLLALPESQKREAVNALSPRAEEIFRRYQELGEKNPFEIQKALEFIALQGNELGTRSSLVNP